MPPPPAPHSSKPTIAGVFAILGFLASLFGLIAALILESLMGDMGLSMSLVPGLGDAMAIVYGTALLGMVGGIMCAIFSFQRKKWMLALVGAILLLASTHFLTGIIALILVLLSKNEFQG